MMFKFHVKLLEDLHQKKVVVSEMFQLIVDKDLSFENSQGRSTTHGMFEKATFSGPIFLFAPFSLVPGPYQPTKSTLFLFSQQTSSFTTKKSHTTKPQIFISTEISPFHG